MAVSSLRKCFLWLRKKEGLEMLTAFDKALLNELQGNLPLHARPFAVLADKLGACEQDVLKRLRALRDEGYLRRIGPFFDSEKLGYCGTLIALKVEESCMEAVALAVNAYAGTTHNYEREGEYNLWFTLLTPNEVVQARCIEEIRCLPGVKALLRLDARHKYKVNVQFRLE